MPLPGGLHRVTQVLNAIGTVWILAMMLLINADILGRELFDSPLRGTTEFISISITGIVFLQLADTFVAGRMARADVLLGGLKRAAPRAAALLNALFHVTGAGLLAIILHASWQPLLRSIQIQEYIGSLGDFTMPVWPVRLTMLVGMVAALVACLLLAWLDVRRMALLGGKTS